MTLARRLALALGAVLVLLVTAGSALVLIQRDYTLDQLDARLAALSTSPRLVAVADPREMPGAAGPGPVAPPPDERGFIRGEEGGNVVRTVRAGTEVLGDVYVGLLHPNGTLRTVQAPAEDPGLVPDLTGIGDQPRPTGRPTVSGQSDSVRVMVTALPDGDSAVVALPTTSADQATRRLMATVATGGAGLMAVLALIVWWVHRFGLAPIARMTRTAEAIAGGARDQRWESAHPGTEAHRLGQALNTMLTAEQATQDRMRRFVADASHELRTPLTTLRGYSALHAGQVGQHPTEVEDALRRINDEARRMNGIVEALLDLNNLDEHGVDHLGAVDVVPLLRAVVADLGVVAPGRQVSLEAPEQVLARADADRLTQAVLSLTSNALRHTPDGTPVVLRAAASGPHVRVEVADAGPGIPAEHLPHLFDRFY
ncbi:HAMP domain-containing sensor histidine kinase, partial [Sporichthya sp.]|uniref:sensor histidine kinase n=1 Tax=Sporichthya sp. TaxID=65475 RepID=UPI0017DD4C42